MCSDDLIWYEYQYLKFIPELFNNAENDGWYIAASGLLSMPIVGVTGGADSQQLQQC